MRIFSALNRKQRRWQCKHLKSAIPVSARQEQIPGFDQEVYSNAVGLFVGAGGGGEVIEGAVRKGIGIAHICDFDDVEETNLCRQKFSDRDLFHNKAQCLCRNMSKQGFLGTTLIPHPCAFQELDIAAIKPNFVVCAVDMQIPETRLEVCKVCHQLKVPCIFLAISTDADWGYVFVQEAGQACWACVFKPELQEDLVDLALCPGVPSCCDPLKMLGGIALYAIDTVLMKGRIRDWNYRVSSLSRSDFGAAQHIERRDDCPVCGNG